MRQIVMLMLALMSILVSSASSCSKNDIEPIHIENNIPMTNGKITIKVNSQVFTATLLDNNAAKALKEMLPLTINMVELNNNEKYYDLPNSLPTKPFNPITINNGDLMLYGSKTLVLFYKTFSTSYSYTKLGTVNDTTGLALALGSGNVTVTFALE